MGLDKCSVANCTVNLLPRHRFPNPKDLERLEKWREAIQNPALANLTPQDLYMKKKVCHLHFEACYFSPSAKRLFWNAIPSLYLPPPSAVYNLENAATSSVIVTERQKVKNIHVDFEFRNNDLTAVEVNSSIAEKTVTKFGKTTPARILKNMGILHKDMSTKERKLYGVVKSLSKQLNRSNKSKDSFKRRLFKATKLSESIEPHLTQLNQLAAQFLRNQIREAGKSPKQRRYTVNEKILALSLYKHSPKCYRFLAKIFTLPSKSTLNNFLKLINFNAGINDNIFRNLEIATSQWDPSEKIITVMWDELSLMPNLAFNEYEGRIEGFGDIGENGRSKEIADHVLVYMIRGMKKRFKQPVCYTFTSKGGAKPHQIKTILKDILSRLVDIGLRPIATICDQATSNVSVLKSLMEDTKAEYLRKGCEYRCGFFEIKGLKVYPIFDPPHLLKCIRNNLMVKNLSFQSNNITKIAKWRHIIALYENDNGPNAIEGLRVLPHLTDEHVYPKKIKKMKVKNATQIFSQRVASTLYLASQIDVFNTLGLEVNSTAELLLFFDRLFDSVNGNRRYSIHGKILRCGISENSDHIRFWQEEALPLLTSMKFLTTKPNDKARPPCLVNWIFTIKNFINIWKFLKDEGFEYMLGRHINQDPLENFFGQVRSHGILYTNPTPATFTQIFKTMLVNSTLNMYSPTFNCQEDDCEVVFMGIKHFVNTAGYKNFNNDIQGTLQCSTIPGTSTNTSSSRVGLGHQALQLALSELSTNYVAGFLLKIIKVLVRNCETCRNCLFGSQDSDQNSLIKAREYMGGWAKRLCYPSVGFVMCFYNIHKQIIELLKKQPHSYNVLKSLTLLLQQNIDFSLITCDLHKKDLILKICRLSIRTMVHAWCKDVNRLMVGKDTRTYEGNDSVKMFAHQLFLKRQKRLKSGKKIM